jgi:hypothetical protein
MSSCEWFIMFMYHDLSWKDEIKLDHRRNYSEGKAIPLQAWTGPEGSRRLRLPDFKAIGT